VQIPSRITQSWIERTVPTLSEAELGELLRAMRTRDWTDDDIATRVLPYATHRQDSIVPADKDASATDRNVSVDLQCPSGHVNVFSVASVGTFVDDATCKVCSARFAAIANVTCRGLSRERYSRTTGVRGIVTSKSETRVSSVVRVRYRNPEPPPVERLVVIGVRGTAAQLQVRSGDQISIIFKRTRKGLRASLLISHTLELAWPLRGEGLFERMFDLVF
jgi:hypothetical protein